MRNYPQQNKPNDDDNIIRIIRHVSLEICRFVPFSYGLVSNHKSKVTVCLITNTTCEIRRYYKPNRNMTGRVFRLTTSKRIRKRTNNFVILHLRRYHSNKGLLTKVGRVYSKVEALQLVLPVAIKPLVQNRRNSQN